MMPPWTAGELVGSAGLRPLTITVRVEVEVRAFLSVTT
jgi:hypothetical protein